jgi:hypothetical protein
VLGLFTPVLAKHSKSFSLVDCTSWDRSSSSVEQTSLYFSDLNDIAADKKLSINGLSADYCGIGTPEISQKAETFGPGQSYEDSMLPRNSEGTVRIRHECGHVDRTKRRGTTDKQSIAGVRSPTDSPLSVQFRYN